MYTRTKLETLLDKRNHLIWHVEVPWHATSMSHLYNLIREEIEDGELIDITYAKPISFSEVNETIKVELCLNCSYWLGGKRFK